MSLTCAPLTPSSSYCLQENNAFVLCRVVPQKIDVDCSDSIWRGKLENSSTNCAQNEFRCWALLRVVFSPLWRPGVPGSSRIYLSFPLKCKMVGGSDPGGRTTTVAAPIRIHHQRFPIQLRDWLIPARNLFPPNPAGTAGCHTTHDSVLRKARTYNTRCRSGYFICCLQRTVEH
jgi:hypothetical protein